MKDQSMTGKVLNLELELSTIDHLFEEPELSPFSPAYRPYSYTSGIKFIEDELYSNLSFSEIYLTLTLPHDQITPNLEARTQEAVQRYSRARLLDVEHFLNGTRQRGMRSLIVALVLVTLFMILSTALAYAPSGIFRIISEGLAIAAWVVLWFPLDTLFFGTWEYRLERRKFKLLQTMKIQIKPAD